MIQSNTKIAHKQQLKRRHMIHTVSREEELWMRRGEPKRTYETDEFIALCT